MKKHIRALSRPIHRKEAEGNCRYSKRLPIKITEMFGGQFANPIRGYRSRSTTFPHRQIIGVAVDGRRRGVDEFSDFDLLARFQQNLRRQYIVMRVVRKLRSPTGANPRLGSQMKYIIRLHEQLAQINVDEIIVDELEGGMIDEFRQIQILEVTRIIVQELVNAHDFVP